MTVTNIVALYKKLSTKEHLPFGCEVEGIAGNIRFSDAPQAAKKLDALLSLLLYETFQNVLSLSLSHRMAKLGWNVLDDVVL